MSKNKQRTRAKGQDKQRRKPVQTDQVEETIERNARDDTARTPLAAGGDSLDHQAARLRDERLMHSQRQDLAAGIARLQGNQHLQRVMATANADKRPERGPGGGHEVPSNGRTRSPKTITSSSNGKRAGGSKSNGRSAATKRASADRARPELVEAAEPETDGSSGAGPPTMAPVDPPSEKGAGSGTQILQRQEAGDEPAVSPEEKAAALAAAQAAKAQAGQAKSKNQTEIGKSRAAKSQEAQKASTAKSKKQAESAAAEDKKSERKAAKEKAGIKGKRPKGKAGAPSREVAGALADAAPTSAGEQAPSSPAQDPGFQAVVGKAQAVAEKKKAHVPAAHKAADAQAAAVAPVSEQAGKAATIKAEEIEATEAPGFDKAAFKAKVMERIQAMAPKTAEDADSFKESGKLDSAKGEMKADVAAEKEETTGPIAEKSAEQPDPGAVPPKPVKPLKAEGAGETPPPLGAEKAAPKPKARSEVEKPLEQRAKSLDDRLKEAEIKEETLANSNEPEMVQAVEAKREAQAHAEQAPREYRLEEESKIAGAKQEAQTVAEGRTQAMHSQRASALSQIQEAQVGTKSEDEAKRAEIAGRLNTIYAHTKAKVESILGEMDREVESTFDAGASAAKQAFEDYVESATEAWKQERYGGWLGWARWIEDQVFSHPEIMRIANRGRELFLDKMNAVVDNVVEIIARGITEAKAEVASGRKEMGDYLASLPEHLQQIGQQAAGSYQDKFDQLEADVDAKQDELVNTLAEKYNQHLEEVNARISEIEEENKGLYDKAKDAVEGAIQTILRLKDMLLNVLASAAAVIDKIIGDPIGFLGNLISGVKQGFENFVGNILSHLQAGLIGWLTGAMGDLGIEMPDDIFSLEGIFSLVMQVLGITYDYIRSKAVKHLGEPVVKALETGFEVFQILMNEGPAGLWKYVKDQFTDLKEMVIEQIKTIVIEQVIKAGVKWVLGLMSPAGALVKAAMMIYDIVMFFIQRAGQIVELVQAVINSVAAIASGSVGQVASAIENALAKALPVVISFMANLLGLRGLSKKVKRVITRVRRKVDRAIDKLILKAKKAARGVLRRLGVGKQDRAAEEMEEAFTAEDRSKALAAFEKAESARLQDGKVSKEAAQETARSVKREHPVIESVQVVDGGDSWDYQYVMRATGKVDTPPPKLTKTADEARQRARKVKNRAYQVADQLPRTESVQSELTRIATSAEGIENQIAAGGVKTAQIRELNKDITRLKDDLKQIERETGQAEPEDEAEKSHGWFKPRILDVTIRGDIRIVRFGYEDENDTQEFVVRQRLSDFMTISSVGTNLTFNPFPGMRGKTEAPDTHRVGRGFEAAHLVPDWFGGSGYRESLNLISTSANFNKSVMGGVEREIAAHFDAQGAASMTVAVTVEWGDFLDEEADRESEEQIKRRVASMAEASQRATREERIASFIAEQRSRREVPPRRCENVKYRVRYFDRNGNLIVQIPYQTGPDKDIE